MVVLAVTWIAKAGAEQAVADLFRKLQSESRKEPGCRFYQVHTHRNDPRRFFIYEQYEDDAALQAHRDSRHFQELAAKKLAQIAERQAGDLYQPVD
ncbi:MAG TPA: putative quinol monooxygenase [Terriglobales bacterium]|nr:putative quinol monooxygenase [Terriglobales bacterium]